MHWTLSSGCSRSTPPYLSIKKSETLKVCKTLKLEHAALSHIIMRAAGGHAFA